MRRLGGGAGRSGSGDALRGSGGRYGAIPRLVWCGARARGSQPCTRAASGLRPEVLRPPARSWLTWIAGPSPLRTLAAGMRQIPGQGSNRRSNPRSATSAARPPMTRLRLSVVEARQRKHAKIAAMERPKARRLARGVSTKDVAPTGAPSPLSFSGEEEGNKAQPARPYKRAAERWLFDN
jgi:hypothetical protein